MTRPLQPEELGEDSTASPWRDNFFPWETASVTVISYYVITLSPEKPHVYWKLNRVLMSGRVSLRDGAKLFLLSRGGAR